PDEAGGAELSLGLVLPSEAAERDGQVGVGAKRAWVEAKGAFVGHHRAVRIAAEEPGVADRHLGRDLEEEGARASELGERRVGCAPLEKGNARGEGDLSRARIDALRPR